MVWGGSLQSGDGPHGFFPPELPARANLPTWFSSVSKTPAEKRSLHFSTKGAPILVPQCGASGRFTLAHSSEQAATESHACRLSATPGEPSQPQPWNLREAFRQLPSLRSGSQVPLPRRVPILMESSASVAPTNCRAGIRDGSTVHMKPLCVPFAVRSARLRCLHLGLRTSARGSKTLRRKRGQKSMVCIG